MKMVFGFSFEIKVENLSEIMRNSKKGYFNLNILFELQ